jgi:hypothetical protein
VVDGVKVRGDIPFDDSEEPLAFVNTPLEVPDRVHRPTGWPEPKGIVTEIRLKDGLQNHPEGFLYNPVLDGRNPKRASLAMGFRNVHPSHRVRFKRFRLQFLGELGLVGLQVFIPGCHGDAVATRGGTTRIASHMIMGQAEPIHVIEQVVQVKEPKFLVLCRPLAEFSLHFADVHLGFPCVRTRLVGFEIPTTGTLPPVDGSPVLRVLWRLRRSDQPFGDCTRYHAGQSLPRSP